MTTLNLFEKDPAAILDYTVRWTDWLNGDTISSSAWFMPSGALVKANESNTTTDAVIWLASGSVDSFYTVTNRIITAGGRQDERPIRIHVKNKEA